MTAAGGTSDGESDGISIDGGLVVDGGSVTASGARAGDFGSNGISIGGEMNVRNNGSVTATGGDTNSISCGVNLFNQASLTIASGGILTAIGGASTSSSSYGVKFADNSGINTTVNNGTLTATGGTAGSTNFGGSYGITNTTVNIDSGTVNATGGTATNNSIGVNAIAINISGGTVNATGGTATIDSYGVYAKSTINISGGTVTAKTTDTTGTAKAMSSLPNLSSYTDVQIKAGSNSDGTVADVITPGALSSASIGNYKYLKFEQKSTTPSASAISVNKSSTTQASITFDLTTAPDGTYRVYANNTTTTTHSSVTASLSGTSLTLTDSGGNVAVGTYYVSVTEDGKPESNQLELRVVFNAESPVITNNLSTNQVEYNQNAVPTALNATATATVTDGGSISYEWYSNTVNSTNGAISLGVTTATYTPSTTTVGTTYYYCVVTNNVANEATTAQTISDIANIKVNATEGNNNNSYSDDNDVYVAPVITVSEVKSELFSNASDIKVEADVNSAFGQSVTVKITDITEAQKEIFSLAGANEKVYPFDISLYSMTFGIKVEPKQGYSVKITLPVPQDLLEEKEKVKVVYGKDGKLEPLNSELAEKNGKWYISFEAVHFSPYALIVSKETSMQWTNPFSDVKEDDWFYSAVQYAVQNGLMNGASSNSFSPETPTSRGMIAAILYRLSGSKETSQSTFKDVNQNEYYANAVAWAQQKGIITGYGNGLFGPDDSITREQLSTMLWKYAGSPVADESKSLDAFHDAKEISPYAKNAITWANQQEIIKGKGGGLLVPSGKATRAEVAQIMKNFMQKSSLIK